MYRITFKFSVPAIKRYINIKTYYNKIVQLSIYTYFIKSQIYFFENGIVYRPSTVIKKKLIFLNIFNYKNNYNYKIQK